MKKLFGIKTTIHGNIYKKYIFWLPLLKIIYKNNSVRICLFGIQVTSVHNPTKTNYNYNYNYNYNIQMLQMRSVECIKKRSNINYLKGNNKNK